jgi:putative hydrolase of the HAD superfamily
MSQIRAVAVDLGGVVFLPEMADPWSGIGAELGLPASVVRDALWHSADIEAANIGALTAEAYADRASIRLGRPAPAILAALERVYTGKLNEPLVRYLRTLPTTTTVAALTNNWSFLDRLLSRHDIADLFSVVVNSAEVGCCKPSSEVFAILLERLGCEPTEVAFLDDDPINVSAAAALGFQAIHFQTTEAALAELEARVRLSP